MSLADRFSARVRARLRHEHKQDRPWGHQVPNQGSPGGWFQEFPLSKQTENEFDGDAHAPNDWFATKNLGVYCYASKKCLIDHGFRFTL